MKYSSLITILFLALSVLCCQVDDRPEVYEEGSVKYTNDWMYTQMKKYYKWNETMPDRGDLSVHPKEYFARLLQKDDVYSYALHPTLPETAPQSLRRNFGFDISFVENLGKIYGVILYALIDSPAKNNGLVRGQLITKINGEELNANNYDKIYKNIATATHLDLQIVSYSEETGFSNPQAVSLQRGFSFSQPVVYNVITEHTSKIGYVEIPHFDVGQAQLYLQIFQELKNQNISEVILDLRYNGGGDIASATALSSILAPNIQGDNIFIKFEGNANGGNVDQSFTQALQSNESQVSFDALRNVHPAIERLYILCGKHTASASELIINNLRPYMQVITIGGKTFGKDVAGFPIEDDRIAQKKGWVLYPAIYKLFNAAHQGNYTAGINSDIYLDEIQQPEVLSLGNKSEILLAKAISSIVGSTSKKSSSSIKIMPLSANNNDAEPLLLVP